MSCCLECKSEVEKKDLRKKAEEYLSRAEQLKQMIKDNEGSCQSVSVGNYVPKLSLWETLWHFVELCTWLLYVHIYCVPDRQSSQYLGSQPKRYTP